MIDEDMMKQARRVFKTACSVFDEKNFAYEKDEDELSISCTMKGDDLPVNINIQIQPRSYSVVVYSAMPYRILPDAKEKIAVAVSVVNWDLPDGNFDYDYKDESIMFRTSLCYKDSLISKEAFDYMIQIVCLSADEYNDKFLLIAKSDMTLDQIVEFFD